MSRAQERVEKRKSTDGKDFFQKNLVVGKIISIGSSRFILFTDVRSMIDRYFYHVLNTSPMIYRSRDSSFCE